MQGRNEPYTRDSVKSLARDGLALISAENNSAGILGISPIEHTIANLWVYWQAVQKNSAIAGEIIAEGRVSSNVIERASTASRTLILYQLDRNQWKQENCQKDRCEGRSSKQVSCSASQTISEEYSLIPLILAGPPCQGFSTVQKTLQNLYSAKALLLHFRQTPSGSSLKTERIAQKP